MGDRLQNLNFFGWYPTDFINRVFRKKRAIRAMFIGESSRFETRVLVPQKDARKGEEITYRGGLYNFDKAVAMWDSDFQMPFVVYQVNNPVPLPVNVASREDWLTKFVEVGGKTAMQYSAANRAKIVENLFFHATADLQKKIQQLWIMGFIIIGLLLILGYGGYQMLHAIQGAIPDAATGVQHLTPAGK